MQARALGLRIASLLQDSEFTGKDPEATSARLSASDAPTTLQPIPTSSHSSPRYNVIIHTSPYLRCLQTAIGVSAGLGHYRSGSESSALVDSPSVSQSQTGEAGSHDLRPLLRVDAFLGEWLSPDYFDQIVPPPASDRMVASAKAELLRRGEGIPMTREIRSSSGHFPGGWGSPSHSASLNEDDDRRLSSRGSSTSTPPSGPQPPQRPRASTYDNLQGPVPSSDPPRALGRLNTDLPSVADAAYVPPTPGYAVSPSDPIPAGYVAHARDACTRIDYQWDSMRTPYWGTGGDYGEEWSSMHERVHAGFQHMVDYYRQRGSASDRSRAMSHGSLPQDSPAQTVLIIISHGADCNALIGSLAGRSVLLDISTASLTMAVRRDRLKKSATPDSDRSPVSSSPSSPSSQGGRSVSQEYSLQLIASNDHLRAGVNPSQLASLSSPSAPQPLPPPSIPTYRNRLGYRPSASILQGTFLIDPTPKVGPSSRSWSTNSHPSPTTTPRGASGLWGSLASPAEETGDAEDVFVPNFGDPRAGDPRPVSQDSSHSDVLVDRSGWAKQLPQRTLSQRGLWGSAPSLEDRDAASRRRWTVTEQKL